MNLQVQSLSTDVYVKVKATLEYGNFLYQTGGQPNISTASFVDGNMKTLQSSNMLRAAQLSPHHSLPTHCIHYTKFHTAALIAEFITSDFMTGGLGCKRGWTPLALLK